MALTFFERFSLINFVRMQGSCKEMCPPSEIEMRQKNALIHLLETDDPWRASSSSKSINTNLNSCHKKLGSNRANSLVANPAKMVKEYSRSAADKHIRSVDVRPFLVLEATVDYLLKKIISAELSNNSAIDLSLRWPLIYSFVVDRLRAVRQDMTVQQLPPNETIVLLEKMLPFYIVAPYLFETDGTPPLRNTAKNKPSQQFDQKLHTVELDECFFKWKNIVDECGLGSTKLEFDEMSTTVKSNAGNLSNCLKEGFVKFHGARLNTGAIDRLTNQHSQYLYNSHFTSNWFRTKQKPLSKWFSESID